MRLYNLKGGQICDCSQLTKPNKKMGGAPVLLGTKTTGGAPVLLGTMATGGGMIESVKRPVNEPIPNTEALQQKLTKLSQIKVKTGKKSYINF